jgi:hypothetical protein
MPKEPPAPFPPPPPLPPREPFLRLRTPREGTLLGVQAPPPPAAPAGVPGVPAAVPGVPWSYPAPGLERQLDALSRELASFRALITRAARSAQPAPPPLPSSGRPLPSSGRRRRPLVRQALAGALGVVLALGLALVSAAAALSWPDYARVVARAARLQRAPAPGDMRAAQREQTAGRAQ